MSMLLRFQSLLLSPCVGTFTFVYNSEEKRKRAFLDAVGVLSSMKLNSDIILSSMILGKIVIYDKIFLFLHSSAKINGLQFDQVIYDEIEMDKEKFIEFQSRIKISK